MREYPGGRPYIGPKGQTHIPMEDWEVIEHIMKRDNLNQADALRVVVAAGAASLRSKIGAR